MLPHLCLHFYANFAKLNAEEVICMDISALSTYMSMSNLSMNVNIAVMSKILDTAEASGEALLQMTDAALTPGLGELIDIRA